MKGMFADRKSPIAYGYDADALPIYFSSGPVLSVGAGGGGFGGGQRGGPSIPGRRPEPDAECHPAYADDDGRRTDRTGWR